MKKRIYNSTSRKAQALQTRARVLGAAKALFETEGFEEVTIETLAARAEVSVPTIYALFRNKRGVLRALMDEALPTADREELVKEAYGEGSPVERIAVAAKIARQLYDAEKAQMKLFQGASVLHPQFKELETERERRRYRRLRETIRRLSEEGVLAAGLSPERARDILWAFTGRDLYRMLVIERKWSSNDYEAWLAGELARMLLA